MGAFSKQALGKQYNNFSDELMAQLFPHGFEDDDNEATAPRETTIGGQEHMLAYINPQEEEMLQEYRGNAPVVSGPDGVPSYFLGFFSGNSNYNSEQADISTKDGSMPSYATGTSFFGSLGNDLGMGLGIGEYTDAEKEVYTNRTNQTRRNNEDNRPPSSITTSQDDSPAYTAPAGPTAADTAASAEAAKRSSALSGLTGEFATYNENVDAYNTNFDAYKDMYDTNSGLINNAGISNIYDDPNTEENENYFTNYNDMFGSAADDLSSFSLDAPSLTSGDYTFDASELPDIAEARDYSGLASDFRGLQSTLSGLQADRGREQARIENFAGGLNSDLGAVAFDIDQLQNSDGTYDLSNAGGDANLRRFMFNANRDRNNFSSDILDQIDDPFNAFDTGYTAANTTLGGFDAARDAEQTRIDSFNDELFNYSDTLRGADSLGGYDLTSGDALDTLKTQIDDRQRQAGRFDSQMGYDFGDGLTEIQELENQLDGLIAERDREQGSIDSYRSGITNSSLGYGDSAAELGIADLSQINALQNRINTLKRNAGRFENPLAFDFSDLTGEGSDLADVEASLQRLRDNRATEEARIGAEGNRLAGLYDEYSGLFGGDAENDIAGLNISNLSELEELRKNIDAAQLGANRFESELSTSDDFRYPMEDLSSLEGDVNRMFTDRQDELDRIDTAQTNYGNAANAAEKSATSGNYYSQAALDAIQERITSGQRDITGFDSLLDYNFGAAGEDGTAIQDYADAQTLLDDLTTKRAGEIDTISEGITGATSGLNDLNPYDEAEMNEMLAALGGNAGDLNYFSGGRVGDLRKDISTGKGLINDRLDSLYDTRDQYETDALEMLTSLGDSDYSRANYDEYAGMIEPLRENIDLYDARQAGDEIRGLDNEMARRLALVEADELAVQTRLANAASDYGFKNNYPLTEPLTEAGYYNLYNEEEEELDEFGNPIVSAFSSNVRAA